MTPRSRPRARWRSASRPRWCRPRWPRRRSPAPPWPRRAAATPAGRRQGPDGQGEAGGREAGQARPVLRQARPVAQRPAGRGGAGRAAHAGAAGRPRRRRRRAGAAAPGPRAGPGRLGGAGRRPRQGQADEAVLQEPREGQGLGDAPAEHRGAPGARDPRPVPLRAPLAPGGQDAGVVLARPRPRAVESLVSAGGRAPSRCYAAASDVSALPLPPGTSFEVKAPKRTGDAAGRAPNRPRRWRTRRCFEAACGTPVVAATAGTGHRHPGQRDRGALADQRPAAPRTSPPGTPTSRTRRSATATPSWSASRWPRSATSATSKSCALGMVIQSVNGKGNTKELDPVEYLTQLGAAVPDGPTMIPETSFRIATYNVLGYHLTAPGGGRPGWGNGASRVAAGKAKLEAAGVDIVVLNEFESPQAAVFEGDPEWTLYRAAANNTFRDGNYNGNAIAWKTRGLEARRRDRVPGALQDHPAHAGGDAGEPRHRRTDPGHRRPQPGVHRRRPATSRGPATPPAPSRSPGCRSCASRTPTSRS